MDLHKNEQCQRIQNFPKYWITTEGRVWSEYSNRWLIPTIAQRGNHKRAYVSLGRGNKKYVHRLVAEAFIPNPLNLPEVDHKDTNGLNNCVENLQWVTRIDNMDNPNTQNHIKQNTGYFVEIEEIATGKLFIGYDSAVQYSGLSRQTILNHTKGKVKNPKWRLTGKRFKENEKNY